MSRGAKIALAAVVAAPVILITIVALNAPREATKDYHFPTVLIDATVHPDGTLELDERRTFDFRGDFTFATFTVDWPFELIEGFEVSEGGRPLGVVPTPTADGLSATWNVTARDEL